MSITTALLVTIIVLFSVNLIVLVAMISPILSEVKLILRDVRQVTNVAKGKAKQIDEIIDKVVGALGTLGGIMNIWKRCRDK